MSPIGTSNDVTDQGSWVTEALETYEGPLMRYTTRLLGDSHAASDVVQECFLRLCKRRQEDVGDHLAEWLFSVCRNRALDLRKKRPMNLITNESPNESPNLAPGPTLDPTAALEQKEERSQVLSRIGALSPRQQEVLRLKFEEGLSYKQISAITDISVSNVGFILHSTLRRLRNELTDAQPRPEQQQDTQADRQARRQA